MGLKGDKGEYSIIKYKFEIAYYHIFQGNKPQPPAPNSLNCSYKFLFYETDLEILYFGLVGK